MELVSSWVTARLHLVVGQPDLTFDYLHCDLFYLTTLRASFIPAIVSFFVPIITSCPDLFLVFVSPSNKSASHAFRRRLLALMSSLYPPLRSPFHFHFCLVTQPYWLDLSSIHESVRVEVLVIFPSQQCLITPLRCHLIFLYMSRRT
jgi:hypothetical protein